MTLPPSPGPLPQSLGPELRGLPSQGPLPPGKLPARVHVIGTGLIGTSAAIALSQFGVDVTLADASPTSAALAADLGGGVVRDPDPTEELEVVIVATPPDVTARVVAQALSRWPSAYVTDVASVKGAIRGGLVALGVTNGSDGALARYVGGHPMAGRERSGAIAARSDLFSGRSWVLAVTEETSREGLALVRGIAEALGSVVAALSPAEHDAAVAAVSHVPQVTASLVASRLEELPDGAVALAGQGLRDVTRIAASDPQLWTQILAGNAGAVAAALRVLAADLGEVVKALDRLAEPGADHLGARAVLARAILHGNAGHDRIPGKHGAAPTTYRTVTVMIPDAPGQLGRLFRDVGEAGVNLEDFHIEHGLGHQFGLLELAVLPAAVGELESALRVRGWRLLD